MNWTVNGAALVVAEDGEEGWEPFEGTYSGETKADARWAARYDRAPGEPLAELTGPQPSRQREAVEIEDDREPREEYRTESELEEYDRLVETVKIESVVPA